MIPYIINKRLRLIWTNKLVVKYESDEFFKTDLRSFMEGIEKCGLNNKDTISNLLLRIFINEELFKDVPSTKLSSLYAHCIMRYNINDIKLIKNYVKC